MNGDSRRWSVETKREAMGCVDGDAAMRTEDATIIRKTMVSAARSSTVAQSAVDGEAIRTEERQDPGIGVWVPYDTGG